MIWGGVGNKVQVKWERKRIRASAAWSKLGAKLVLEKYRVGSKCWRKVC